MEQNNTKPVIDLSFYSILKMFKGKFKVLVAIGVISALLGGTIGALTVTMGQKLFGTTLAYYLPTPEQSGYSNIIPLLESDMFTENIVIGYKMVSYTAEEKTLDIKIPDLPYSPEEEAEIAGYEYTKIQATKQIKDLKDELKKLPFELNILKAKLDEKTAAYTELADLLDIYTNTASDQLAQQMKDTIADIEIKLNNARAEKNIAEAEYNTCLSRQHEADQQLFSLENQLLEVNTKSEKLLYDLRAEWKASPQNRKKMEDLQRYTTYSFTKDGTPILEVSADKEEQTGKFLYISVAIPENQELANKIIHNITAELPEFIIANTSPTEKSDEIECINVTSGEAKNLSKGKLISNIIKFSVITFVIFEAITVIAVISSHIKRTLFPKEATLDQIERKNPEGEITDGNSEENKND